MQASILLADAAQGVNGRVHALGLGWNVTTTPTPPAAVVLMVRIPWDQTNAEHEILVELVDADGHAVPSPGPGEGATLQMRGKFEAGRPPGIPAGSEIQFAQAIGIGPGLPLTPGQFYEWRMTIDGEHKEGWSATFYVR